MQPAKAGRTRAPPESLHRRGWLQCCENGFWFVWRSNRSRLMRRINYFIKSFILISCADCSSNSSLVWCVSLMFAGEIWRFTKHHFNIQGHKRAWTYSFGIGLRPCGHIETKSLQKQKEMRHVLPQIKPPFSICICCRSPNPSSTTRSC